MTDINFDLDSSIARLQIQHGFTPNQQTSSSLIRYFANSTDSFRFFIIIIIRGKIDYGNSFQALGQGENRNAPSPRSKFQVSIGKGQLHLLE